jgi:hypothetical protein
MEDLESAWRRSWLFQIPPGDSYETNQWLTRNWHGLDLHMGHVPYGELYDILKNETAPFRYVFAKGLEKCNFLSAIIGRPVIELGKYFDVPKLASLPPTSTKCDLYCHQTEKFICAVKNCSKLKMWILNNVPCDRFDSKLKLI